MMEMDGKKYKLKNHFISHFVLTPTTNIHTERHTHTHIHTYILAYMPLAWQPLTSRGLCN